MNETRNIIHQLENQRNALDRAISALREIEGLSSVQVTPSQASASTKPKGGGISPEGRARIAEATRRRWAAKRAAAGSPDLPQAQIPAKRKKRRLSPEGRERIAEATRRRWAAKRAADAAGQTTGTKTGRKRSAAQKSAGSNQE